MNKIVKYASKYSARIAFEKKQTKKKKQMNGYYVRKSCPGSPIATGASVNFPLSLCLEIIQTDPTPTPWVPEQYRAVATLA
jgi:hypothetical protein